MTWRSSAADPAGSTAASLLARAGRKVLLVEREKFPRFHIGESLLPYSMGAFDRLGLREKLDAAFQPKCGGEIATTCGSRSLKFYFKDGFRLKHHRAYQVMRAEFDKMLLDHARASGVEVREETKAAGLEFHEDHVALRPRGQAQRRQRGGPRALPAGLQRARHGCRQFLQAEAKLREPGQILACMPTTTASSGNRASTEP